VSRCRLHFLRCRGGSVRELVRLSTDEGIPCIPSTWCSSAIIVTTGSKNYLLLFSFSSYSLMQQHRAPLLLRLLNVSLMLLCLLACSSGGSIRLILSRLLPSVLGLLNLSLAIVMRSGLRPSSDIPCIPCFVLDFFALLPSVFADVLNHREASSR
jgi:hypothetical protein